MENLIKKITRLEMKAMQDKVSELFSSEFAFQTTVPVRTCSQQIREVSFNYFSVLVILTPNLVLLNINRTCLSALVFLLSLIFNPS